MAEARSRTVPGRPTVEYRFTERTDGDLAVNSGTDVLVDRRRRVVDLPWTWLEQVHGDEVVVVRSPGGDCGRRADALVTASRGAVLSVHSADCAPVLFWSTAGIPVVGAAHAGWRGLYEGVVEATVAALWELGAEELEWSLGPHISAAAYEFSPSDLTTLALRFGPEVVAATTSGAPALDLGAAVRSAVTAAGLDPAAGRPVEGCTATAVAADGSPRWFSHRARADRGRQASLVWLAP